MAKPSKQNQESLGATLQTYFNNSSIPACVMGSITDQGELDWYAYGPAIWGGSEPVNADHLFRIASMTKPITAIAAFQLIEKELITLDEPLNDLLPEMAKIPILDDEGSLRESKAPITLRQLLNHTAGFGYTFSSAKLMAFDTENWEHKDGPRIFEPGTAWQYGTSTYWVGKMVEKISGQDLERYFREHITGPLGMNHTWFNVPDHLKAKIVSWGSKDKEGNYKEYNRVPRRIYTDFRGDGGLFSSLHDYAIFLKCILNGGAYSGGRILKKETLEFMLKDQLPSEIQVKWEDVNEQAPRHVIDFSDELDRWSFLGAFEANPNEKVRSPGSFWWSGYYNTYFTVDLKKRKAVIFLSQYLPFLNKSRYEFFRLFERAVLVGNNV
jgi:methyl acetate hydrolase